MNTPSMNPLPSSPAAAGTPEEVGGSAPRPVRFVGGGINPALGAFMLVLFVAPTVVTLLLEDPTPSPDSGTWLFALFPFLIWSMFVGSMAWAGLIRPLQQRWLVMHGDIVPGQLTTVDPIPRSQGRRVTYTFTPHHAHHPITGSYTVHPASIFSNAPTPPQPGQPIHVAYAPSKPTRHAVLGQCSYLPVSMVVPHTPGMPVFGILMSLILAMTSTVLMGEGELRGIREVRSDAGPLLGGLNLLLLGGLVVAVASLIWSRRQGTLSRVLLWRGLIILALTLSGFGGLLFANRTLPSDRVEPSLRVQGEVCLAVLGQTRVCLLELATPPALDHVVLVRSVVPVHAGGLAMVGARVGQDLPVEWHSGALGTPYIVTDKDGVESLGHSPTVASVASITINKGVRLEDLARQHQLSAVGRCAPGSLLQKELDTLGVQLQAP